MKKGEKLEMLIKEKFIAWKPAQFADYVDMKRSTLYDLIKKEDFDRVSIETIRTVANGLDMTMEELLFRVGQKDKCVVDPEPSEQNGMHGVGKIASMYTYYQDALNEKTIQEVNYYGSVSAGHPQTIEGIEHAEKIKLPKLLMNKHIDRDDIFVMKINGESMNKILPSNSLIICLPVNELSEVKDNDIVVFSKDNETSVKRYKIANDKIIFSPESTNNKFFDIVINKDNASEIKILAKVISYHVVLD